MSEHPDTAHYTLSQTEIMRMRDEWITEGRQQAATAVRDYAEQRLLAIKNGGPLPVIPQASEDIVAALRVAANRARGRV